MLIWYPDLSDVHDAVKIICKIAPNPKKIQKFCAIFSQEVEQVIY